MRGAAREEILHNRQISVTRPKSINKANNSLSCKESEESTEEMVFGFFWGQRKIGCGRNTSNKGPE